MSASNSTRKPVVNKTTRPMRGGGAGPKPVFGTPVFPATNLTEEEYTTLVETVLRHTAFADLPEELKTIFREFMLSDVGRELFQTGKRKHRSMQWGTYTPSDYKVRNFQDCAENDKNGDTSLYFLLSAFVFLANNPVKWETIKNTEPHPMACWDVLTSFIETHIFPLVLAGEFLLAGALITIFPMVLGVQRLDTETNIRDVLASGSYGVLVVNYVRVAWSVHIQMRIQYLKISLSVVERVNSLQHAKTGLDAFLTSLPPIPGPSEVIDPSSFDPVIARRSCDSLRKRVDDSMTVIQTASRIIPTREVIDHLNRSEITRNEALRVVSQITQHIDRLTPPPTPVVVTPAPLPYVCTCGRSFKTQLSLNQHNSSKHGAAMPVVPKDLSNVVPSLNEAMIVEEKA